jgi:alpha-tubulin suppressor-like RCC1 family protein
VFYDSDADLRALTSDGTLITTNRQCQIFDGVKVYQIDGNHREFWLNTGTFECTNVTQLENGVYRQNLIESYSTSVVRVYDTPAIKMHFGREHMFIKTESGYMVYGKNNYFQFGQETPAESNKFINAKDVNDEKFIEIYIGGLQGYGKKANGTFYGWGYNEKGRLGNGPSETHAQKPTLMPYHKLNIVEVFPAGWSTMGLTSSGDLYGWGIIGNDYKVTTAPTLLVKNKIRQVFTGPYEKTYFAVTKTGKVFAWGQE